MNVALLNEMGKLNNSQMADALTELADVLLKQGFNDGMIPFLLVTAERLRKCED